MCRSLSPELFLVEIALTSDAVLFDVRTQEERRNTPGLDGALSLDILADQFEERLSNWDKHRPYFLYCDTGKRSRMACEIMVEQGFVHLSYLAGGLHALQKESDLI